MILEQEVVLQVMVNKSVLQDLSAIEHFKGAINSADAEHKLFLFDIQMFTQIELRVHQVLFLLQHILQE